MAAKKTAFKMLGCLFVFLLGTLTLGQAATASLKPLPIEQAFQFSATAKDSQTLIMMWDIAPNHYLYQSRFHFRIIQPQTAYLGNPLFPPAITKTSPDIGRYQVYENHVSIPVPILDGGKKAVLQATYQGCSAKGYCYPPTTKIVAINLLGHYMQPVRGESLDVIPAGSLKSHAAAPTTSLLQSKSFLAFILGFFGFGVLISLTPCVLPMVPILSSIIVGQKNITHVRSFGLSLAYVFGMAITYAIAGIILGYLGSSVQAALQKPWIIILFSFIFILMALSLFGFYQLQPPEKWRGRIAQMSQHQKSGHYFGVAIMGCLSTLILSPCVTAPLVGALGYISQTGDTLKGGIALFFMGLGMGLPLLIIGASSAKLLPKAGAWMNGVKNMLGLIMLGMAIYMLQRILPGFWVMWSWAVLAIITGLYLGALSSVKSAMKLLSKIIGLIIFIYGILLSVGALQGNYHPLSPIILKQAPSAPALTFAPVKTMEGVTAALRQGTLQNKIVMLDFYADWCIACKEMDAFTFANKNVQQQLSHFLLLRADVTANNKQTQRLEQSFGVIAPPTILFFRNGKEIPNSRIIGEMSAKNFLEHLDKIINQQGQ